INKINDKKSYLNHISSIDIATAVDSTFLEVSYDFSKIRECSAIIICVPTPLTKQHEPDISYILNTGKTISKYLEAGMLIVLESTTYPGTTENELRCVLESDSGLVAGKDFYLAYSPEREDPGNPLSKVQSVPKVIGGYTSQCLEKAISLYIGIVEELVPVSSCSVAEATKITENIFRAVNIALINELKIIYDSMGIDIWEVVEAAKTKPYGYMPFYPGPGLGGHCIPIDPFYLTWKAKEFGKTTRFIELAGEINRSMPYYVLEKIINVLNNEGKSVKGSKVLLLGLAYKPDIDDERESPTYPLMHLLENMGAIVYFHDPHIAKIGLKREYSQFTGKQSAPFNNSYDLLAIITNHSIFKSYDFTQITVPIVDTRNSITKNKVSSIKKYYKA
ncbi:MAG: nucleotide sugar dehydrogenase, partial [Sphaerospermopsis kisseleviana]